MRAKRTYWDGTSHMWCPKVDENDHPRDYISLHYYEMGMDSEFKRFCPGLDVFILLILLCEHGNKELWTRFFVADL